MALPSPPAHRHVTRAAAGPHPARACWVRRPQASPAAPLASLTAACHTGGLRRPAGQQHVPGAREASVNPAAPTWEQVPPPGPGGHLPGVVRHQAALVAGTRGRCSRALRCHVHPTGSHQPCIQGNLQQGHWGRWDCLCAPHGIDRGGSKADGQPTSRAAHSLGW